MRIDFKKVNYTYNTKTPYERKVLQNIDFTIEKNSFTAVIGKTGSGKSTLIEHINGLLLANNGYVLLDNNVLERKKRRKDKKELENLLIKIREKVAILFQFSEQQLFEETVLKDIMFGPVNYGTTLEEAEKRARDLVKLVGLDESYLDRSPFELSGGEMRKVALCGVLALEPKVLVLDEPTIGLDFKSKSDFMNLINKIYKERNLTVIFVTHNMEYVLEYATNIVVMSDGEVVANINDKLEFLELIETKDYNLIFPDLIKIQKKLINRGIKLEKIHLNYDNFLEELQKLVRCNNE